MNEREIRAFVRAQMKAGEDSVAIIKQLIQRGLERKAAGSWMERIHSEWLLEQGGSAVEPADSLLPALLGGLVVAVVTGGLWAVTAVAFHREIHMLAWGVGVLCALAVVFFARGRRGLPCQLIAVLSTVVGLVIGQYGLFFHRYQQAMAEQYGAAMAARLTPFSSETVGAFFANLDRVLSGGGLLWMGLGIATAWGIPKAPIEPPQRPDPDPRQGPAGDRTEPPPNLDETQR
jgi:hypothetical protein